MPSYPHQCKSCNYQWEESYSIKAKPPTKCPKCNTEGQVRRLIALNQGVSMEETVADFKNNFKSEQRKLRNEVNNNENLRANLMGEEAYHNTVSNIESIEKDLNHKS